VVEADGGGEGEEAGADAGVEAVEGAGAVAFEGEEVFAGVEDRFDSLPDGCEVWAAAGFVFAAGRMIVAASCAAACSNSRPA
jgi:hypothetical protein